MDPKLTKIKRALNEWTHMHILLKRIFMDQDVLEKLEREMAHSRFLKLKSERWDGQSSWVAQKTENFEN
jgi:hypothetical protein